MKILKTPGLQAISVKGEKASRLTYPQVQAITIYTGISNQTSE